MRMCRKAATHLGVAEAASSQAAAAGSSWGAVAAGDAAGFSLAAAALLALKLESALTAGDAAVVMEGCA